LSANTHVAVNVIDNRPTLYINNELVATGLQSTKLLHPPTEVGGISWGYFSGSIHDVRVWNEAFLWQAGSSPDMHPQYEAVALSIPENAAAGSVVSPSDSIVLKAASQTGVAGTSGQHYALSPLQGAAAWGSAAHAGLGLSVGVNGISVYQHSSNLLSSLLTWSGTVACMVSASDCNQDSRVSS